MIKEKILSGILWGFIALCTVTVGYVIVDWCDMSVGAWIIVLGLSAGALVCRA